MKTDLKRKAMTSKTKKVLTVPKDYQHLALLGP